MAIIVFPETFVQAEVQLKHYSDSMFIAEFGTVEIELNGKRITVEARRFIRDSHIPGNRDIGLMGFVGRYRTSNNPWAASVIYRVLQDRMAVNFGRDDRSGRFNKLNLITYEPETYRTAS